MQVIFPYNLSIKYQTLAIDGDQSVEETKKES
jgi:hypothetical protein